MKQDTRSNYDGEAFIDFAIIQICFQTMMNNPGKYFTGHMGWVNDNQHIVSHFFQMADENRIRNIKVAQRFICEHLRWKSLKREIKGDFKTNNDNVALLAHMYNDTPGREGYFRVKDLPVIKLPRGYEDDGEITCIP